MQAAPPLALLASALLLCGCVAAAPAYRVPRQSFESLTPSPVRSIDYELVVDEARPPRLPETRVVAERLERHLERAFERVDAGLGHSSLHLEVNFSGHEVQPTFGVLATALSLGIIPYTRQHWFSLVFNVTWNGEPLRTYSYTDSLAVHEGWAYLPRTMSSSNTSRPGTVASHVVDNMVLAFLLELNRDLVARGPIPDSRVARP